MKRYGPHTLYGRLVLAQLLLFGAIAILLPTFLLISLHRTTDAMIAQRLKTDVQRLAAALTRNPAPTPRQLDEALGPFYRRGWAVRAYRVSAQNGAILYRGGVQSGFDGAADFRGAMFIHRGNFDLYQQKLTIGGRPYRIAVAQNRTHPEVIVDDVVATFLRQTIWIIPLVFLGSMFISLLFFRRLTATMRHVAKDAERIGPDSLDQRLPAARLPMEARSLVDATNRALDRVEEGYRQQNSFVSNVAHELRTPLALVTLRCEALPDSAEKDGLKRAINQASHIVSQLMELAVIEGRPPIIGPVNLQSVARETVETSAPLVYRSGRTIEAICDVPTQPQIYGNESLLAIALTNLIDNAVRHTPEGTHIVIAATQDAVFISDNGPGLAREQSIHDGEGSAPHCKASSRRNDGAGLGMAIVQRIMRAMDGDMTVFVDAPGTHIRLRLPAVDARAEKPAPRKALVS